MRVKYQATGTDLIPNKNIWIQIPGLIKVCACAMWSYSQAPLSFPSLAVRLSGRGPGEFYHESEVTERLKLQMNVGAL